MNKFLIIGLGNPGDKYKLTKHNVGFMAIDYFSEKNNFKFNSNICDGSFYKFKNNDDDIYVLKPQTFMNLSGECVLSFIQFYKIDYKNILVIYDDLHLSLGKIRLRKTGSSGGQNGIQNIIDKLKTNDIKRIRIGIGKPINKNIAISDYVLSNFSNDEISQLESTFDKIAKIINNFYLMNFEDILIGYNND